MKVSISFCLLLVLCFLFMFLIVNTGFRVFVREGMENKEENEDDKEIVTAKKEKRAEKLPF